MTLACGHVCDILLMLYDVGDAVLPPGQVALGGIRKVTERMGRKPVNSLPPACVPASRILHWFLP